MKPNSEKSCVDCGSELSKDEQDRNKARRRGYSLCDECHHEDAAYHGELMEDMEV